MALGAEDDAAIACTPASRCRLLFAAAASEPVTRVKKLRSVLHLRCSLEENIAEKADEADVARVMFDRGKKLLDFAKGNVRARARKAKLFPKVANGSVILCHD